MDPERSGVNLQRTAKRAYSDHGPPCRRAHHRQWNLPPLRGGACSGRRNLRLHLDASKPARDTRQMSCSLCQHEDHGTGPCATCTVTGTGTCWQRIKIAGGDGDQTAHGVIEMATGTEERPCLMCRKWELVSRERVVEHFLAKGLEARPDGRFKTPIAKDYPGRKSLVLDPRNFGFCRRDLIPVEAQATCSEWTPTKRISELQDRLTRRE